MRHGAHVLVLQQLAGVDAVADFCAAQVRDVNLGAFGQPRAEVADFLRCFRGDFDAVVADDRLQVFGGDGHGASRSMVQPSPLRR